MYLGKEFIYICVVFYENLSTFHDIETDRGLAMKATLLINSWRMAFYLLAFDVRHLCKGYGRMQLRTLSLQGPPSECLLVLGRGHPSENIDCWTVSACVCIRKVASERNCKCLCMCFCVCCLSLCTNGGTGEESHPEGKGLVKRRKKVPFSSETLLPLLCFLWLLIHYTHTHTHKELPCF